MIISFTNTITSSALYHWMVSPNGQGIITLLAFIILVIYTWSTIRLWKESKKQTELLSAPSIIIEEDRKNKTFMATNIGKGVALNVQLSRIRMYIIDIPREPLCLEFNEIDILKPNETKSFDVNKREGSEFIKHAVLPGKHTDKNYRFNL